MIYIVTHVTQVCLLICTCHKKYIYIYIFKSKTNQRNRQILYIFILFVICLTYSFRIKINMQDMQGKKTSGKKDQGEFGNLAGKVDTICLLEMAGKSNDKTVVLVQALSNKGLAMLKTPWRRKRLFLVDGIGWGRPSIANRRDFGIRYESCWGFRNHKIWHVEKNTRDVTYHCALCDSWFKFRHHMKKYMKSHGWK